MHRGAAGLSGRYVVVRRAVAVGRALSRQWAHSGASQRACGPLCRPSGARGRGAPQNGGLRPRLSLFRPLRGRTATANATTSRPSLPSGCRQWAHSGASQRACGAPGSQAVAVGRPVQEKRYRSRRGPLCRPSGARGRGVRQNGGLRPRLSLFRPLRGRTATANATTSRPSLPSGCRQWAHSGASHRACGAPGPQAVAVGRPVQEKRYRSRRGALCRPSGARGRGVPRNGGL
jgi:hypothetical protein